MNKSGMTTNEVAAYDSFGIFKMEIIRKGCERK